MVTENIHQHYFSYRKPFKLVLMFGVKFVLGIFVFLSPRARSTLTGVTSPVRLSLSVKCFLVILDSFPVELACLSHYTRNFITENPS